MRMNWPNRLTLLRLLLVPVVVALILVSYYAEINSGTGVWKWYFQSGDYQLPKLMMAAGIVFIVASFTDFLDGYLARKYNQVTDFGKFFDPIADKLLVNSVLILFAVTKMLPVWMTLILILRDIFVDFIRMTLAKKNVTLAAGIYGKLKTVFQMVGLSLLFFVNYTYFELSSNAGLSSEYGWMNQVVMIPMYLATFFSIFSGCVYFKNGYKYLFKDGEKQNGTKKSTK
ncbi:CDP-diacylglycerol--glycerol-3-phosphate 3-phosphatidyltransferase [Mesoplasma lactucae]|uniref:CDP-diacylglycerol--glycerol-3-phosphate 3-phosphatidyltransferase n=1 Tax=Mesoplasma lactucae ATCC 49193 TaxID=81460 RepID=A0A291ISR0_9MOLU|nr:CDP-diacylglycerol--glycerol-3-phosphate 3-phosphatidyltransferase [Mesoplasma lactucae]ATG97727.1 CDP-diacylglycerol--glycerol-3-phosphate 3-phosphatidyltransferase [Mesoplasma lactucae ATCC 49193]ATZ20498.1 CDP-diacylglycerol--glycerol-3-phosphate 3-phosphatidyltransferase [Mesoplasma lactucae ATCC 49193]MCL8216669.1 CDP-diacylglycerol--glycerol-3-phosphate 3-phosphatidyltransferase [Mesoplasma lactucae ATCC 49193]